MYNPKYIKQKLVKIKVKININNIYNKDNNKTNNNNMQATNNNKWKINRLLCSGSINSTLFYKDFNSFFKKFNGFVHNFTI